MIVDEKSTEENLVTAFRLAWDKYADVVELGDHSIKPDGVTFQVTAYDPFVGTAPYTWSWDWEEIQAALVDPSKIAGMADSLEETIAEDSEPDGDEIFVEDEDGRIHFGSDLEG